MKKYALITLGFLVSFLAQAQNFIPGTEDIPLMDNLVIEESETVSFDTPDGQILNLTGHTSAKAKQVLDFYNNTLQTLGWVPAQNNTYRRDKDELSFTITPSKQGTTITIQLTTTNN